LLNRAAPMVVLQTQALRLASLLAIATVATAVSCIEHLVAAGGLAPKLALADFGGLRGVAATESVTAGEMLLEVPLYLCFSDTELSPLLVDHELDSTARLAAALLCARHSSYPTPRDNHFEALPTDFSFLLHRMSNSAQGGLHTALREMLVDMAGREALCRPALERAANDFGNEDDRPFAAALRRGLCSDDPSRSLGWALDVATTRAYGVVRNLDGSSSSTGDGGGSLTERAERDI